MKTTDYLVKSMTKDGKFRAYAVNATQLVEKAHEIHDTWSASSAALGRTLVGTLLLATAGLQGEAGMTVKIQGNGPVGYIVADGTAKGTVKGYMGNPHVNLPSNDKGKIDVAGAVGTKGTRPSPRWPLVTRPRTPERLTWSPANSVTTSPTTWPSPNKSRPQSACPSSLTPMTALRLPGAS